MDSLSRGASICGVTFISSNAAEAKLVKASSPSNLHFSTGSRARVRVSASFNPETERKNSVIRNIRSAGRVLILTVAASLMIGKLSQFPARAESPVAVVEEEDQVKERQEAEEKKELEKRKEPLLSQFLESRPEAVDELKSLVMRKLEDGEDEEALKTLKGLVSAQPSELQWKILLGRLLNEMGEKDEARKVFEEVLSVNPLCFEVLFLNSLLMDQSGEGQAALQQLHEALELAKNSETGEEANNVRLIMAQIYYLQKDFDEALKSYQEVSKEDPKDFRPYFYQGIIYHQLDRKQESNEQFAKCREVCPEKFDVEVFLQTTLSRMKIYGTDMNN